MARYYNFSIKKVIENLLWAIFFKFSRIVNHFNLVRDGVGIKERGSAHTFLVCLLVEDFFNTEGFPDLNQNKVVKKYLTDSDRP